MKQYSAYLFDLYGTLADIHTDESGAALWRETAGFYTAHGAPYSGGELKAAYLTACRNEEAKLRSAAGKDAHVELDLERVFAGLYLDKGVQPGTELIHTAALLFRRLSTTHLRLYAGAPELLSALRSRDREVVLLSNAQRCFTEPELRLLNLWECFDRIFISSDVGLRKPDPRFFSAALNAVGLSPTDCLMIGNDPVCDVGGAASVGMDAVYIHSALSPQPAPPTDWQAAKLRLPHMDLRRLARLLLTEDEL